VRPLSTFPAESPIRTVVEAALRAGSASATARTTTVREADVPTTEFHVEHDGRVVRVVIAS
jgi:hypothetical protein